MTNWFEVEFVLLKQLKLQPSELDRMEFYRVEYLMENYKDYIDKEAKTRKERESEQMAKYNPKSMTSSNKGLQQYMKGTNPYKGLKTPKF